MLFSPRRIAGALVAVGAIGRQPGTMLAWSALVGMVIGRPH
jgi:hypothetical protein